MTSSKRPPLGIAAALACLFAVCTTITPADAAGQTTLRACYVPNTGVVYRIGVPDAPENCRGASHVEFSWTDGAGSDHGSLSGLGDDDHPQYLQADEVPSPWAGFEQVSTQPTFGVPAESSITVGTAAACPTGKIVINGGYSMAASRDVETRLVSNGPAIDGTQWAVVFRLINPTTDHQTVFLQVSGLCVTGP